MIKLVIQKERCKACGLCIVFCPQKLLELSEELNEAGYRPVKQNHPEKCTGCGICAVMCPDICFSIYRIREKAEAGQAEAQKEAAP